MRIANRQFALKACKELVPVKERPAADLAAIEIIPGLKTIGNGHCAADGRGRAVEADQAGWPDDRIADHAQAFTEPHIAKTDHHIRAPA